MKQQLDSLAALEERISEINGKISAKEERLASLWHSLSKDDPKRAKQRHSSSIIQRGIAFAADSAEVIDGVIFGWKLYRRLGGTVKFFKRRKK